MCGSVSMTPAQEAAQLSLAAAAAKAAANKKGALTVAALVFASNAIVYHSFGDTGDLEKLTENFVAEVNQLTS